MKFKTQLTAKDIFKFSMMYSYSGTSGIFFSRYDHRRTVYVHQRNHSGAGI